MATIMALARRTAHAIAVGVSSGRNDGKLTVAVTGPTGDVGRAAVRALEARPEVGRIIGMARRAVRPGRARLAADRVPPRRHPRPRLGRRPGRRRRRRRPPRVHHLRRPRRGPPGQPRGLAQRLRGDRGRAARRGSSTRRRSPPTASTAATAAGSPRTCPPPGREGFYYSAHKAELESLLAESLAGSATDAYVFRPCIVAGADAPTLVGDADHRQPARRRRSRPLRKGLERLPVVRPVLPDTGVPFQLVHTEDVAAAIAAAVAGEGEPGVYNLAAPDELTTADLARELGWATVPVPKAAVSAVAAAIDRAPLTPGDRASGSTPSARRCSWTAQRPSASSGSAAGARAPRPWPRRSPPRARAGCSEGSAGGARDDGGPGALPPASLAGWLLPGRADGADARVQDQLVRTYSPITMLREQDDPPCDDDREQYEPTTVNTVLGNPRVSSCRPPGAARGRSRRRPRPTSPGWATVTTSTSPGDPLTPGLHVRPRLRHARLRRRGAPAHLRPHPPPTGGRAARGPVLVLLLLQPVQRPARVRLGGDAADLRREHRVGGARARARRRSACSSTAAASRRTGTTRRSRRTARTRSSTRPRARTRPSTARRSTSRTGAAAPGVGCDNASEPLRTCGPAAGARPDAPAARLAIRVADLRGPLGPAGVGLQQRPDRPEHEAAVASPAAHPAEPARDRARCCRATRSPDRRSPRSSAARSPSVSTLINLAARTPVGADPAGARDRARDHRPADADQWRPVELEPLRERAHLRADGPRGAPDIRPSLADPRGHSG